MCFPTAFCPFPGCSLALTEDGDIDTVSGQEDFSHQLYQRKLQAPLWPSSLGITDCCQYITFCHPKRSERLQYSRDFLLRFRFCDVACQRPVGLVLMEGVTDTKPERPAGWAESVLEEDTLEPEPVLPRTVGTIQHCLHLTSVYTHFLPQHGRPEVTTMPLGLGTTVDYIFFSAESCENRNRTGKPGGSWVHRSHPQKSLGIADSRSGVWSHGLGYWDLTHKVADFIPNLALVVLIIIPLDHLPAFSFCSIRERWADQPHLYLRGKNRAPGSKWILNKAAI
uniref:Uncharacterized protein n=1 Tax=Felis catus TaxID=9685 RepID=A0ABI7XX56_FELCA